MAIVQAFATRCYSMKDIAQAFEIHYATVGWIVKMTGNFWEIGDLIPWPVLTPWPEGGNPGLCEGSSLVAGLPPSRDDVF